MAVVLSIFFACLGAAALAAMTASLQRYLPFIGELRRAASQSPDTVELRLRVEDLALIPTTRPRRRRQLSGPKPVRHRLHGRNARRAIA